MPLSSGGRYGRHIARWCFQFNYLGQSPRPAIPGGFSPVAGFSHPHSPYGRSLTDCGARVQGISELNSPSITAECMKVRPSPHSWVWRSTCPRGKRPGWGLRDIRMLQSGRIWRGSRALSRDVWVRATATFDTGVPATAVPARDHAAGIRPALAPPAEHPGRRHTPHRRVPRARGPADRRR